MSPHIAVEYNLGPQLADGKSQPIDVHASSANRSCEGKIRCCAWASMMTPGCNNPKTTTLKNASACEDGENFAIVLVFFQQADEDFTHLKSYPKIQWLPVNVESNPEL